MTDATTKRRCSCRGECAKHRGACVHREGERLFRVRSRDAVRLTEQDPKTFGNGKRRGPIATCQACSPAPQEPRIEGNSSPIAGQFGDSGKWRVPAGLPPEHLPYRDD